MSGNLLSICDCPTICKTLKYIDQSDNSFWCVLGFDTKDFGRLIADWLVENLNPWHDLNLNVVRLVYCQKKIKIKIKKKRYNKHLFLIRLALTPQFKQVQILMSFWIVNELQWKQMTIT